MVKRMINLLQDQRAFSLLEAILAIGIMAAVGIAVLSAIDTNTKAEGTLDERVTATHLATACIENLRNADYASDYTEAINSLTPPANYNVGITIECTSDGETFGTCEGGETLQKITIQVSFGDKPVYSTCTYKSSYED